MKKGFTLIELLAVILILGIIALIAVPQVTNVIDKANGGAAETTGEHYIGAINTKIGLNKLDANATNDINDGDIDVNDIEVDITGEGPKSGVVVIENGSVKMADLEVNGYNVLCNKKGKCTSEKGSFRYYAKGGDTPESVDGEGIRTTRPSNKKVYIKFLVVNNTLTDPKVCAYDEEVEICINPKEADASRQKVIEYFQFDKSSWDYNSTIETYLKIAGDYSVGCQDDTSHIMCRNTIFSAEVYSESVGMSDNSGGNISCGLYSDGYAYCSEY